MNETRPPAGQNLTPGFAQEMFPGIEQQPFAGPPAAINPTVLPAQPATASKLPFNLNLSSLNDLKSLVDRMGGIDGVLSAVGKVQKFMSTMQQVAPLIKLFMNKKSASSDSSIGVAPRKRRRPASRRSRNRKRSPAKRRK